MIRKSIFILAALCACADAEPASFDLPALGSDGKADDSTPEVLLNSRDANGWSGEWTGEVPAEGQAAVASVTLGDLDSIILFEVELVARRSGRSAGEPHLYIRRASDGSVALELHGEAAIASGSFALTPELGGPYQLALFVTESDEGDFAVRVRQNSTCSTDRDTAEPNEDPASASPVIDALHSGTVCNGSMSFDRDYFTVPVGAPDRVLRAGLEHVPAYGELTLVVEGPFGPLEQTRTQAVGQSLSDAMVTVAIDRVAESTPEFGAYLVGVWSDQLYNVYTLMTCLDDGLEDDGVSIGNNDAEAAVSVAIGTTYERAVICPILGANYAAPESDDADYYAVDVPPDTGLSIRFPTLGILTFDGPPDALSVGADSFELSPSPSARRVVFGLTAEDVREPIEYDLIVEAI